MKIALQLFKEDKPKIVLQYDWMNKDGFEESVIDAVFGKEGGVIAFRTIGSIFLERMDKDLELIIQKYYNKKQKSAGVGK